MDTTTGSNSSEYGTGDMRPKMRVAGGSEVFSIGAAPKPARARAPRRLHILACISGTEAVPLLARAQAELMAAGLAASQVMMFWDDSAVLALEETPVGATPIGVISFAKGYDNAIEVRIAYVVRERRRQGVFRELWDLLQIAARRLEATEIRGLTATNNLPMRDTAAAIGWEERGVFLRYIIPAAVR